MDKEIGRALYLVHTWVPEDQLEEWDRWHTEVHVPEVVSQPQVVRGWKYRVMDDSTPGEWHPQYITMYEFSSLDDCREYTQSAEAARLRKEYSDRYGATGRIARQVMVEVADIKPADV